MNRILWIALIMLVLVIIYGQVQDRPRQKAEWAPELSQRTPNEKAMKYEGVFSFLGQPTKKVIGQLGEPKSKGASAYGYEWWVYPRHEALLMIGIEKEEVVTLFLTGQSANTSPYYLNQTWKEANEAGSFQEHVELKSDGSQYTFRLTEDEQRAKPLIQVNENYVQLYFDTVKDSVSSIRVLNQDVLLRQKPYHLTYRGKLPQEVEKSPETDEQIDRANEQLIFEMTNEIRKRFNLSLLEWDEDVAQVAKQHSHDMFKNNYFSHVSPDAGDLGQRMAAGEVTYQLAGENIATQYVDGMAAVEGWLNSPSHRKTLLNDEFDKLGVGVTEKYYTQNFLQDWSFW
ncbi:CAP domain-containing protein [Bacillaceae bacterium SIJ1]|uniref:CAP domain-containing protein n=1 Tax=Litoribacterium kuwaitense TaxID=1398745 RepID=UPI0013EDFF2B|nr:CAP domain-containing protein [Litoribacterium kuwaitense]NGP44370.1 CAP domain-containing protein [Litoribacterium kuwaitense]